MDDITLQCTSGPSEGAIFTRTGNATVLKVGRTRISQIHVKDPAVSEKHAEVRCYTSGSHQDWSLIMSALIRNAS